MRNSSRFPVLPLRLPLLLSAILTGADCAAGEGEPILQPVTRDAATHEQLVEAGKKAAEQDPMKALGHAEGPDPSVAEPPRDLIRQSDILCFQGLATLVPKRALLQMPQAWSERMKFREGCRLVGWQEFLKANRGWIMTVEVTRTQAEGHEPLSEESRRLMSQCRGAVVATCHGGPISVLAPASAAAGAAAPATRLQASAPH